MFLVISVVTRNTPCTTGFHRSQLPRAISKYTWHVNDTGVSAHKPVVTLVSVPTCATSQPACHKSSQLGWAPARFGSGMAVHPGCGWQLTQLNWPLARVGDPCTCRGQAFVLRRIFVSTCSFLVERTSRARMGSLTVVKLDDFPAAAADGRVLGTACGARGGGVTSRCSFPGAEWERPGMASGIIDSDWSEIKM